MGLEILNVGGPDKLADYVASLVTSSEESMRKMLMRRRVCLFRDDFEVILQEQIGVVFANEAVRHRFYALITLSGASSFLKRISNDIARPVYAHPPSRRLWFPGDQGRRPRAITDEQVRWNELVRVTELNQRMDLVARLFVACSPVFVFGRHVRGVPVLDVATADTVSAIPDPERPTKALGYVYEREVSRDWRGRRVVNYVVVDDRFTWELGADGKMASAPVAHGLGRIPAFDVRPREHWGGFYPRHGADLESAALRLMFIDAIINKKHKSQSHIQLAATGETEGVVKQQVLDEESVLIASGSGSLVPLNLEADPGNLLKTKNETERTTAANYGISMARLNQEKTEDDAPLNERTAEVMGIMADAEAEAFDLLRALARGTEWELPDGVRSRTDYRALSHRMKPMEELDYWDRLESKGLRSPLDNVYALNPETASDEDAWAEFNANVADKVVATYKLRALNVAQGAMNADEPGQTPEQNGAMGPKVRDGEMSKDDAAEQATGKPVGEDDAEDDGDEPADK